MGQLGLGGPLSTRVISISQKSTFGEASMLSVRSRTVGARHWLDPIARNRGDLDAADEHLTDALALCREGDHSYEAARMLVELGELSHAQEDSAGARKRFAEAVESYREMGAIRDAVDSLERLAGTCEALDDHDAALAHYETTVALVEETEFLDPRESLTERRTQLTADLASESDSSNTDSKCRDRRKTRTSREIADCAPCRVYDRDRVRL